MLTQGPQVASRLSCPCRNDEGMDTVSGTVRFAGTLTLWLLNTC
jgi:hypothetical protein